MGMEVVKRDGTKEPVKFDKIATRIKKQTYGLNSEYLDSLEVAKKVIAGVYDGVTTEQLDKLAAETAASLIPQHYDYSILAARISISALHKQTKKRFTDTIEDLYNYINPKTGEQAGLIADDVYEIIKKNAKKLDTAIIHDRDFNFDFFGFKTLEKSYLLKIDGKIAETPQHMYMRVACGIWKDNIKEVLNTYEMLSQGYFTHATPTLFNAGTKKPQMSSCFLLDIDDDSIEGIYKTLSDCAKISQSAGGIGVSINKIRGKGTYIKGTNGTSNGIVPMLRVFNDTARYVDQCFSGDTSVITDKGESKISDIKTGDIIKTSSGNKKVLEAKSFEGKTIEVETNKGPIRVTDRHLFLIIKNGKNIDNIKRALKSGLIYPEWCEAKQLTRNDLLLDI